MKTKLMTILMLLVIAFLFTGCGGTKGDSYFNLPEGPKIIFRGGYGKITIKYTPPPDPIFKVSTATQYIEFNYIKDNLGIPDKPVVIEYLVKTSVMSIYASKKTANSRFNEYVQKAIQTWIYTRYGKGQMKVMVDVAKKRITVDPSSVILIETEQGRPPAKIGNPHMLVKSQGFTVVEGKL